MTANYWVIAPFDSSRPEWDDVWEFDLAHDVISIGWGELGDISGHSKEECPHESVIAPQASLATDSRLRILDSGEVAAGMPGAKAVRSG